MRPPPAFRLYLITDRKLAARHGGLPAMVAAALSAAATIAGAGAVAVQLREKDLPARELYELARALREQCSRWGAPLVVNDRLDVAMAAEADGIHLPANSFAIADARRLIGPSRLIGVSTHTPIEVTTAATAGADFAAFGPVFAPLSKTSHAPESGLGKLGEACRAGGSMPVYALGGITADRAEQFAREAEVMGAIQPRGVAVIGAVFDAEDAAVATRKLLEALSRWG